MTDEEDISIIEDVFSDEEDFFNTPFDCPKCGYEYQTYNEAEYYICAQCILFCCKSCRNICDKCNSVHCFRCSNYFENCCQTLCRNCSWFCNLHEDYHCECFTINQCMECTEIICEDFTVKRKNGNIYCHECNFIFCENCDEYTEEYVICYNCTEQINLCLYKKLSIELRYEILQYINF